MAPVLAQMVRVGALSVRTACASTPAAALQVTYVPVCAWRVLMGIEKTNGLKWESVGCGVVVERETQPPRCGSDTLPFALGESVGLCSKGSRWLHEPVRGHEGALSDLLTGRTDTPSRLLHTRTAIESLCYRVPRTRQARKGTYVTWSAAAGFLAPPPRSLERSPLPRLISQAPSGDARPSSRRAAAGTHPHSPHVLPLRTPFAAHFSVTTRT